MRSKKCVNAECKENPTYRWHKPYICYGKLINPHTNRNNANPLANPNAHADSDSRPHTLRSHRSIYT